MAASMGATTARLGGSDGGYDGSNHNVSQQAKAWRQLAEEDGAHGELRHYGNELSECGNTGRKARAEAQRRTAGAERRAEARGGEQRRRKRADSINDAEADDDVAQRQRR